MNPKLQSRLLISTLIIVFFLTILLVLTLNKTTSYKEEIQALKVENKTLIEDNKVSKKIIDSNVFYRIKEERKIDSVELVIHNLNLIILQQRNKLSEIPNRYKGLELDSLIKIAEKRYEKDIANSNIIH